MSKACAPITGRRIRISQCDIASAKWEASNQPGRLSALFRFTLPSIIHVQYSTTPDPPTNASAVSDRGLKCLERRDGCGGLSQELLGASARAQRVNVSKPALRLCVRHRTEFDRRAWTGVGVAGTDAPAPSDGPRRPARAGVDRAGDRRRRGGPASRPRTRSALSKRRAASPARPPARTGPAAMRIGVVSRRRQRVSVSWRFSPFRGVQRETWRRPPRSQLFRVSFAGSSLSRFRSTPVPRRESRHSPAFRVRRATYSLVAK